MCPTSLGYYLAAWVGKFAGKPEESTEEMEIPEHWGFLRDTTISTALTMSLFYLIAAFAAGICKWFSDYLSTCVLAAGFGSVRISEYYLMSALSKLGASTVMIDNLGDDWSSALIMQDYKKYNVNIDCVEIFPGQSSSVANILVEQITGMRVIIYHAGSVLEIENIAKYADIIQSTPILHPNGRHFEASLQPIDIAKKTGTKVSFDGGANRYQSTMQLIVPKVDIYIVAKELLLPILAKLILNMLAMHQEQLVLRL